MKRASIESLLFYEVDSRGYSMVLVGSSQALPQLMRIGSDENYVVCSTYCTILSNQGAMLALHTVMIVIVRQAHQM